MIMMRYDLGQGDMKNWLIEETAFDARYQGKCEAIFCQGNGYIGQRAALEEAYVGQTRDLLVTGTFNKAGEEEVTELPNLPDLTQISLFVDGHRVAMTNANTSDYTRALNLKTGELTRSFIWTSPDTKRFALRFRRFVSLANEHLMGGMAEITALDGPAQVRVDSGIDGRVTNTGAQHFGEGEKRIYDNTILQMHSTTTQSKVTCFLHTAHRYYMDGCEVTPSLLPLIDRRYMAMRATQDVAKGQTLLIEKISCVHTTRDQEPISSEQAREKLEKALKAGYDLLFADSAAAWRKLWEQIDIKVQSSRDYDQLAIRFALYHLNIMVKKDDPRVGIAAKGLSGEGYKGHSFWDTEIFILPYFTLTQPNAARTLLTYRYHNMYGARQKARENGYTGAMYPWESAWIDDGEVTPLWGAADVVTGLPMKILTGILEQHITADIAFAVDQYVCATGDQDFMERYGYEILIDTARFWTSRATWDENKQALVILEVIGPDEYKEHVDNNAYTNYMARHNLKLGLKAIDEVCTRGGETFERLNRMAELSNVREMIQKTLDGLYLPKADADGIIPQFDDYFALKHIDLEKYKQSSIVGSIYHDYNIEQISELQVSKQADVLVLLLLLDDLLDQEHKRRNFLFYEERTLHDSSLSKSTHAVLAADLNMSDTAYSFFQGSCDIDLGPVMTTSDMGIHSASMGGIWQGAVYGFGGVRIVGDSLHISPKLPKAWAELDFPLVWRGQPLRVNVSASGVRIRNLGTQAVTVTLPEGVRRIEPDC